MSREVGRITTRVTVPNGPVGHQFVLECNHPANTNGLGKTQRAIVDYLTTAPAGMAPDALSEQHRQTRNSWFSAFYETHPDADTDLAILDEVAALWHGVPYGVTVPQIAAAVYKTSEPTASQIRVVQRNVRTLQERGLVHCWQACLRYVDRPYTCVNGERYVMPQAVAGLAIAFKWDCQHFAEQNRLTAEWQETKAAALADMLKDPARALQRLL